MDKHEDRKFEMQIEIGATREAVWKAISEAEEIARWFAPKVEVRPGPGGEIVWEWNEHHTWPQTIEIWEPGQHLRTRYESQVDDGEGGKRPLYVEFHLEGERGVTTLRLVHSGFGPEASFDEEYDGIRCGWPVELRSLRHYLEHHPGKERRVAWSTAKLECDPAAAWSTLTGAEGLSAPGLATLGEGERYRVLVSGCEPIEGTVLYSPTAREFSGIAENLDEGWFRLHCERWAGVTQIWIWLALYGLPPETAARYQRAFDDLLGELFPDAWRSAVEGGR